MGFYIFRKYRLKDKNQLLTFCGLRASDNSYLRKTGKLFSTIQKHENKNFETKSRHN